MAYVRKDTLTTPPEWWKHMRPFCKRQIAKAERRAAKVMIETERSEPDETPHGLGLHNEESKMRKLKYQKGTAVIPFGGYCYGTTTCPYWDRAENKDKQNNGYCWFLGKGDWYDEGWGLLWDQCKECGKNELDSLPPEGTIPIYEDD